VSSPRVKDFSILDTIANSELFLEKRMDYDGDGNLIYVGYSRVPNENTSSDSWFIVKLTYDGDGNITRYQLPDTGISFSYVWDNRTAIFS
jgi:YD repeat-containing protein